MARVGRRQQHQQRPKRELDLGQEDGASCRPKRQRSGPGRSERMPSEEDYTTDDFSDEEVGHPSAGAAAAAAAAATTETTGSSSAPSHTRKKTAPPRRWQPHEDKLLRAAVKQSGEANWKAIASKVGTRNHVQCLQRWKKVLRPGLVKGQWDAKEDELLMKLATAPFKNWGVLATRMAGRTSKQCRERWCHHLNPAINKGAYSEKEDQIIIETQAELGNKWSLIAARLPGRTENSIKIRCKALLRKVAPSGGSGGNSGSGGGGGGGGGKSVSASPRPAKKSTGTSTTSVRKSQCGLGGRSLSSSSCFSPATSASASSSCASELNGMAEQLPLNGLGGGGGGGGGGCHGDLARGVPARPPPQQHPPRGKFSFSRGLKFESSSKAETQTMMFPDTQTAASDRFVPPHSGSTGFELAALATSATTSVHNVATASSSSVSEQDSRWRFGSKQDTTSFLPPPSSGGLMPEEVLFPYNQQQQQQQQQQQHILPHPGEFVDFIPADNSFPNAFSRGGHSGVNGGCNGVVLDSSSAPAGGFIVQPQLMTPQPQHHAQLGYSDFIPNSTPIVGPVLDQVYSNHRQANPCADTLDFGDGDLASQTMAEAAVVASSFSAAGLGSNCLSNSNCLSTSNGNSNSRGLTSPGVLGPSDFGQHVDNDLRPGAVDDEGAGEAGGVGGDEQGPIKECCSFLDLANAASADDNLVGEVCPWQG